MMLRTAPFIIFRIIVYFGITAATRLTLLDALLHAALEPAGPSMASAE